MLVGAIVAASLVAGATQIARAAVPTATCGETPAGASKPVKATLALDTQRSKTTLSFGKSTKTGSLSLIFTASGCDLPESPPDPTLKPVPLKNAADIPDDTLKVRDTTVDTDHNTLILRLQALPQTLEPGTYSSLVYARANYLATSATTLTLSRSEHAWWWIVVIGLGCALAGLGLAMGVSFATDKLALSGIRLAIVALLMLASGLYAGISNWWTQDVWTFEANLKGLAGAAFVAASTGTLAGLIGGGNGNGNGGGGGGGGDV
jgi:hypothetical protein